MLQTDNTYQLLRMKLLTALLFHNILGGITSYANAQIRIKTTEVLAYEGDTTSIGIEEPKIWENMLDCIDKFTLFGINKAPIIVYPGNSGEDLGTQQIVSNYVDCGVCWNNKGDTNHLTENGRYHLKRLNIQLSPTNTKSEIKQYIKEAVENGDWVILGSHIYHFTVSDQLDETSMTTANLYEILEYADSLCKIRPTEAIWRERKFMFDIDGK